MTKFCLHLFRKLLCKARDTISRRTVTFGETTHKKVYPLPHLWVTTTPSVLPHMATLLRKFLADRLQALSQTTNFCDLFLHANKTHISAGLQGSLLQIILPLQAPPPPRPLPNTLPPPPPSEPLVELVALWEFDGHDYGPEYLELHRGTPLINS